MSFFGSITTGWRPVAHALSVKKTFSKRSSGAQTGFTDFRFFRYFFAIFSLGSTWEYTGVIFSGSLFLLTKKRTCGLRQTVVNRLTLLWCQKQLEDNMADCFLCKHKYNVVFTEWVEHRHKKNSRGTVYSLVICWFGFWGRWEGFVTQIWTQ